ncbi:hypothetical protein [Chromobacterium subtsugae]|uniref:hypothetical protein n=1 Tax=Chromobacterium subtsugae TaxID=251747 RepID=UPI000A65B1B4|nr:hypothetical protein [Chromobacterium subtsugae]
MRRIYFLALCMSSAAHAQSWSAPEVKAGDKWVYRVTEEKAGAGWGETSNELTVARVSSNLIYVETKKAGTNQPPSMSFWNRDWSVTRQFNGVETLTNAPLSFPLTEGKSWEVKYTDPHPANSFQSLQWDSKYVVVGVEPIEVAAGKFTAVKIEAEGHWSGVSKSAVSVSQAVSGAAGNVTTLGQVRKTGSQPFTGRTYKAFWYVPEIKRWVKSVEEYYGSGGVRTEQYVSELQSFSLDAK